jgi:hypothetical protein
LSDHLPLLMNRKSLVARIGQAIVNRINQTDRSPAATVHPRPTRVALY